MEELGSLCFVYPKYRKESLALALGIVLELELALYERVRVQSEPTVPITPIQLELGTHIRLSVCNTAGRARNREVILSGSS